MRPLNATSIVAGATVGLLVACGTVGPPVPPENVGVNSTIQLQKKREVLDLKQREAAAEAESGEQSAATDESEIGKKQGP